jgi:hypothetical protein
VNLDYILLLWIESRFRIVFYDVDNETSVLKEVGNLVTSIVITTSLKGNHISFLRALFGLRSGIPLDDSSFSASDRVNKHFRFYAFVGFRSMSEVANVGLSMYDVGEETTTC